MFNINVDALAEKYGTGFLFMTTNPNSLLESKELYYWAYGKQYKTSVMVGTGKKYSVGRNYIEVVKQFAHLQFIDDRGEIIPEPFILINPDDSNKSGEPTESPVKDESFSTYIIDKVFSFGKSVEFYPNGSIVIQGEYEDDHVRFEKNQYGLLREYVECMSRARLIENNVR